VALAAVGGYTLYASVRDVPLLEGARELLKGQVPTSRRETGRATWIEDIMAHPVGDAAGSDAVSDAFGSDSSVNSAGGSSALGDRLANAARRYLGRPYVWGGTFTGSAGGDCSGLVQRAFTDAGIAGCPRTSGQIAVWRQLRKIDRAQVRAGDVLWWSGHVAMAVGNAQMIEAPTFGIPVRITGIRSAPLCLRYAGG
jgi:cell wall-associated NlpC family hydrolase